MDKFYYLVAQLPLLVFDRRPPLTSGDFFREADKWLTGNEAALLRRARFDSVDRSVRSPRVLAQYVDREAAFRADLVRWRKAVRDGQDARPETFPLSLVKDGDPLEIEKKLLLHRWTFIEELEADHHFDLGRLVLYFLKLQIGERLGRFDKTKGREIFRSLSKVDA